MWCMSSEFLALPLTSVFKRYCRFAAMRFHTRFFFPASNDIYSSRLRAVFARVKVDRVRGLDDKVVGRSK